MLGWLRTIVDWIFGRPSSLVQLCFKHRTHMERRAIDGRDRIYPNVHMIPTALSGRLGVTVQQGVVLRLRSRNLWMTRD